MTSENENAETWSPEPHGMATARTQNTYAHIQHPHEHPNYANASSPKTVPVDVEHNGAAALGHGRGPLLYELVEENFECEEKIFCCRTGTFKAQFFEHEIVIRNSKKCCFLPKRYQAVVIPKFKLIDVVVERDIFPSCWTQFLAICFLAGGITMLIFGSSEYCYYSSSSSGISYSGSSSSYGGSSSSYGSSSSSSSNVYHDDNGYRRMTEMCKKDGAMIAFGVIFLLIFIAFYIYSCFRAQFLVKLYTKRSIGTRGLWSFMMAHTVVYTVISSELPNEEFLIDYVYGPMHDASKSSHILTHLNMAALSNPLKPKSISDVENFRRPGPPSRHSSIRTAAA
mmetsp:Transcript_15569/g.44975  ORF Transcript_15569/g.44975 Transcript_15569/m.44975 type:complete len:339 (-) Transcript_15569:28-1044(-)